MHVIRKGKIKEMAKEKTTDEGGIKGRTKRRDKGGCNEEEEWKLEINRRRRGTESEETGRERTKERRGQRE